MILLDTHALVWAASEPRRLSRTATRAIEAATAAGGIGISAITLWELAMLFARGRLRAAGTIEHSILRIVEMMGVSVRPITPTVSAIATQLPDSFPNDPADRLIAATAMAEGVRLVTHDEKIRESGLVRTLW